MQRSWQCIATVRSKFAFFHTEEYNNRPIVYNLGKGVQCNAFNLGKRRNIHTTVQCV